MAQLSTERRWQVLLAGSAAWLDAATVCSRVDFCTCVRSQALALVAARSGLAAAPPLQVGSLHLQFILGASLGDVQELLKPPAQKNELPLGRTPFQVGLLQTSGGACAASQVRCFRAADAAFRGRQSIRAASPFQRRLELELLRVLCGTRAVVEIPVRLRFPEWRVPHSGSSCDIRRLLHRHRVSAHSGRTVRSSDVRRSCRCSSAMTRQASA